jgi:hypothetical protein
MDDIYLDTFWWPLFHIAFQSLAAILIYTIYTYHRSININYIWLVIFITYLDWILWQQQQKSIFFALLLTGIILLFWKKQQLHNSIQQQINNNWSDMTITF